VTGLAKIRRCLPLFEDLLLPTNSSAPHTEPGGFREISRRLSEATPPANLCDPFRVGCLGFLLSGINQAVRNSDLWVKRSFKEGEITAADFVMHPKTAGQRIAISRQAKLPL